MGRTRRARSPWDRAARVRRCQWRARAKRLAVQRVRVSQTSATEVPPRLSVEGGPDKERASEGAQIIRSEPAHAIWLPILGTYLRALPDRHIGASS
jgi:hypothetical protein